MVDKLSPERRSKNMAQIGSKNTGPEMQVRRMAHALGYRYRLHAANLPGKPDLVFPSRKKVIFVHGCFWHQHSDCREGRVPESSKSYWGPKLSRNAARDQIHIEGLKSAGWKVLVIWECEIAGEKSLRARLKRFLR